MKNKQVKKMVCRIRDEQDGTYGPWFGYFFDSRGLCEAFPNGSGPDNYYDDERVVTQGVASLTANQLKSN